MIQQKTNQFPVVVTTGNKKFTMYIPDLHVTIEGEDYVELYARAAVCASAVVYYNKEHNLTTKFNTTYEDVEKLCVGGNQFPTYLSMI